MVCPGEKAKWETPQLVKALFGANVEFFGDNQAIFDISENKYRLDAQRHQQDKCTADSDEAGHAFQ